MSLRHQPEPTRGAEPRRAKLRAITARARDGRYIDMLRRGAVPFKTC
jgi:hypothetical protein